jgi:hypothetical protein
MLGLGHVNADAPVCRRDPNADICYGEHPRQRRDIMGAGTVVHGGHARRWLEAIRLHTRHEHGWRATHVEPPIEALMRQATR